jgi:hypothetical protein
LHVCSTVPFARHMFLSPLIVISFIACGVTGELILVEANHPST